MFVSNSKRTSNSRRSVPTRLGYSLPHQPEDYDDSPTLVEQRSEMLSSLGEKDRAPQGVELCQQVRPAIEVELVEQDDLPSAARRWRAVEIWTRNRIYAIDATMTCIEVINRTTGRPEANHSFLGARLGGGQRREGNSIKLSHPLPVPGTEAVFKLPSPRRGAFGQTSKVERVVLRVRVATALLADAEPAWKEITGPFKER